MVWIYHRIEAAPDPSHVFQSKQSVHQAALHPLWPPTLLVVALAAAAIVRFLITSEREVKEQLWQMQVEAVETDFDSNRIVKATDSVAGYHSVTASRECYNHCRRSSWHGSGLYTFALALSLSLSSLAMLGGFRFIILETLVLSVPNVWSDGTVDQYDIQFLLGPGLFHVSNCNFMKNEDSVVFQTDDTLIRLHSIPFYSIPFHSIQFIFH